MYSKTDSYTIFVDGGARGNPGPAAIGVVVKDTLGNLIHKFGKLIGETTNNVAEYSAVIEALLWVKALDQKPKHIRFFLDSELVVSQLKGTYRVKKAHLRDLMMKIRILEQEVGGSILYDAVPREKNREADRLVNLTLDRKNS